jgi:hypothetical protein
MLHRFLLCLKSRFHAHGSHRRHGRFSHFHPAKHAGPSSAPFARRDGPRWPALAGSVSLAQPSPAREEGLHSPACPSECPLCDKHCILAQPRCRHGEAFIQFMRAHGGDPQTRTL